MEMVSIRSTARVEAYSAICTHMLEDPYPEVTPSPLQYRVGTNGIFVTTAFLRFPRTSTSNSDPRFECLVATYLVHVSKSQATLNRLTPWQCSAQSSVMEYPM